MSTAIDHSLDGESKSELLIGLSAAFTVLCSLVVAARIYTRAVMLRTFGVDDAFITVTQVLAVGLNTSTILEARYGAGRHSWLTSAEDSIRQLQALFASIQLYIWALCFVKLSLLLQYRRIFPAPWLQRLALFIGVFACAWNVMQSILVSFACIPYSLIQPLWASRCLESLPIWYTAAAINIATDFLVFLMPIPLCISLQLPTGQRVLLCLVFGLGLFTCGISIVRATTLAVVVGSDDPSWHGTSAAIWSMVEVNCAILCSCLPTIRFLIAKLIPWLEVRTKGSSYFGASARRIGSRGGTTTTEDRQSRRMTGFGAWSRKGEGFDEMPLHSHHKSATMSSLDSPVRADAAPGGRNPLDDVERLHKRGASGGEEMQPQLSFHKNQHSAWITASPDETSPDFADRQSEEVGNGRQSVQARASKGDLGQQILITTTTIVREDRQDESVPAPSPHNPF